MIERPLQRWRQHGIVDRQLGPGGMGEIGDGAQVGNAQARIGRGFHQHEGGGLF